MPAGARSLGELRGEPLNPSVHGKVVDLDAPFGEELLDIAVGQAEPQVPPDGQGDDLGREPVAGEGRTRGWAGARVSVRSHRASLADASHADQCNSARRTALLRRGRPRARKPS